MPTNAEVIARELADPAFRAEWERQVGGVSAAVAARLLGVTEPHLRQLVDVGDLPAEAADEGQLRIALDELDSCRARRERAERAMEELARLDEQ